MHAGEERIDEATREEEPQGVEAQGEDSSCCESPRVLLSPSPSSSNSHLDLSDLEERDVASAIRASEKLALSSWRPYNLLSDFPWIDSAATYRKSRGEDSASENEEEEEGCSLMALRVPSTNGANSSGRGDSLLAMAATRPDLVCSRRTFLRRLDLALEGRATRRPGDEVERKAEAASLKLNQLLLHQT